MNNFGNIMPLQIQVMCKAHEHTMQDAITHLAKANGKSVEFMRRCI
jgi:hypothetical protein